MGKGKAEIGVFLPEGEMEKQLPMATIIVSSWLLRGATRFIDWAETKLGKMAEMVETRRKIVVGESKRRGL